MTDTNGKNNQDDEMRKLVLQRVEQEQSKEPGQDAEPKEVKLTSEFVQSCQFAGQLGAGILFAHINRGKFIFNKTEGRWYAWDGHHWRFDIMNEAHVAVEKCAVAYLDEAVNISHKIAGIGKIKNG